MNCPKCNAKVNGELDITGGCDCRNNCYCNAKDVNFTFYCKPCRKTIRISELGDQYSLSEWINNNYKPSKTTVIW